MPNQPEDPGRTGQQSEPSGRPGQQARPGQESGPTGRPGQQTRTGQQSEPSGQAGQQSEPTDPGTPKADSRRRAEQSRAAKRAEFQRELKNLSPEKKQDLMRVNRSVLGFGLAALAAMAAMSLPLPWPALGLAAIVVALVIAIRGIALARRTPLSSGAVMYMGLGLGLLAMFTLYSIPLIATWQDQWAYQECLQMTQTIQGQDSCRATFEKATEIDWRKLLQGGGD